MKFNIKKIIIWLIVFMFVSFITAGIILAAIGNLAIAVEKIDELKTFKASEINKISINITSTDINITSTDEEEISVHFYGEVSTNRKMELPTLVAYKTGDELRIEIKRPQVILMGISVWRTKLDVYVPEKLIEVLKIDTVSSDTSISNLNVGEFTFGTVSGDFKGEVLIADNLKLNSTSGDINLKNYAGDVNVNVVSGDVVLEDGSRNENIRVVTVSGDVYIGQEDSGNININTVSGEVGINLSEDAQFYLKTNTVSGDIENIFPIKITSSGRRSLEGIVGGDEKEINIGTTSGDINIDYR